MVAAYRGKVAGIMSASPGALGGLAGRHRAVVGVGGDGYRDLAHSRNCAHRDLPRLELEFSVRVEMERESVFELPLDPGDRVCRWQHRRDEMCAGGGHASTAW